MTQYCWAIHEDGGFQGKHDSQKAAIREAAVQYDLKDDDPVYVGEVIEPTVREFVEGSVDLCNIFECIGEGAYEFAGEAAEEWPEFPNWSQEKRTPEEQELQNKIVDLVVTHLEEHDPPHFWSIENIKVFKAREGYEQ